jgi:SAM-dependent methyltransferase
MTDAAGAPVTKPCPVCPPGPVTERFVKFGFRVVACDSCGMAYLDHRMTPDDFRDFYSKAYFSGGEDRKGYADYVADRANIRRSFRSKVDRIDALTGRPGRLLDIGCAAGFFLEEANDRGWEVYGHEVSEFAGGVARERFGDRVFVGSLDNVDLPPASLDVVTMWDVIEHLDDPNSVLAKVRVWLKDDGVLALCTGDIDSWLGRLQGRHSRIYNPPQHLYYYSRRSLRGVIEKAGFRPERSEVDWKSLSLEYFFYVIACVNSNPLTRFLHRHVGKSSWLGRRAINIPLVDNQVMYARRPPRVAEERAAGSAAVEAEPAQAQVAGAR